MHTHFFFDHEKGLKHYTPSNIFHFFKRTFLFISTAPVTFLLIDLGSYLIDTVEFYPISRG